MVERFLAQTSFASQEDFIKNLKINVPENFNFGYDVVDAWAAEQPDKNALLWTNDQGESRQFSFADMKRYTDMTASYFQGLGIGRGDMVMLILKRRYEFWYSTIALHKLGATVIPATHLLTKKDIIYRCNAADIKMIVAAGEGIILQHIKDALPECPSVEKLVSVGPEVPEGFEDFHQGIDNAAPFIRPRHANTNDDISLMYFTSGTTGEPKMVAHDFTYPLGHIVTGSFWHNLDVFQYVSDAAGSQCRGGGYLIFGDEHGHSHFVEQAEHKQVLFIVRVACRDKRHTFQFADGSVRNQAEHRHLRCYHKVCEFFKTDTCRYGYERLFALQLQLAHDRLHKPGLHGENDNICSRCRFRIAQSGGNARKFFFQFLQFACAGVGYNDI